MGDDGTPAGDHGKILLQFVDLHGVPRGAYVPAARWETALESGAGFAALIMGIFEHGGERGTLPEPTVGPASATVQAMPDPSTLVPTPWTERGAAVAQCDLEQGGDRFDLCSRAVLADVCSDLAEQGYTAAAGAELEFTLLAGGVVTDDDGTGAGGRADHVTADVVDAAARTRARPYGSRALASVDGFVSDLLDALDAAGLAVEAVQRESAPGQFEASLGHDDPLAAADGVVVGRQAARGVARSHGDGVTFMPFPTPDYEGNGLHLHVSLHDDDGNAFADPDGGLSAVGRQFVGGVLDHGDALTAVCAPTVNSYMRFEPGTFAPVDRSWGFDNRTAFVRVPPGEASSTRLEVRLPDSYANPYLALAAVLAAGADGVRSETAPPEPDDRDRYEVDDQGRALPSTLGEALDALRDDEVVRAALGEPLVEAFCRLKRDELARFDAALTDWELSEYVGKL